MEFNVALMSWLENIAINEIIRFFEIILQMSLESRKMDWYGWYFTDSKSAHLRQGYDFGLRRYHNWTEEVSL